MLGRPFSMSGTGESAMSVSADCTNQGPSDACVGLPVSTASETRTPEGKTSKSFAAARSSSFWPTTVPFSSDRLDGTRRL